MDCIICVIGVVRTHLAIVLVDRLSAQLVGQKFQHNFG